MHFRGSMGYLGFGCSREEVSNQDWTYVAFWEVMKVLLKIMQLFGMRQSLLIDKQFIVHNDKGLSVREPLLLLENTS